MNTRPKHTGTVTGPLLELAQLYGVETGYRDWRGSWREASPEAVAQMLRALGAEFDGASSVAAIERAILLRHRETWERVVEPVIVAWDGAWPQAALRLPDGNRRGSARDSSAGPRGHSRSGADGRGERVTLEITLEDGEGLRADVDLSVLPVAKEADLDGRRWREFSVPLKLTSPARRRLPLGWHRLRVEVGSQVTVSTLISAPRRAWSGEAACAAGAGAGASPIELRREPICASRWGVFAPLYALRSSRDWGVGDLGELATLQRWTRDRGGRAVATLPLLATYLDRPFEPAPYRPVSRLFWNELFLDVESLVLSGPSGAARDEVSSATFQRELAELRAMTTVDYERAMALKRRVLGLLAREFFADADAARRAAFEAFLRGQPEVELYARFRAATEKAGADWREWPAARQTGPPDAGDFDDQARLHHLYCQWQMEEQLGALSGKSARETEVVPATTPRSARGEVGAAASHAAAQCDDAESPSAPGLFLDMPIGVHPGGYDTWRWPSLFAGSVSAGAPPDAFFTLGQTWDFPPLHPERTRADGHRYFAASVRQQMRHARYLRLDHVMSLHRLFWVPEGSPAEDGVYVKYPAEELYAVLCLESVRHETALVGEDLGTVPCGVRSAMRSHGLARTWVLQASLKNSARDPIGEIPPHAVASINTHDIFPFAGFVAGADIEARVATGQLAASAAGAELRRRVRLVSRLADYLQGPEMWVARNRQPSVEPIAPLGSVLACLSRSSPELVLVTLEDLWSETRPQNQPGTGSECPNWCRKAALSLDEMGEAGQSMGCRTA